MKQHEEFMRRALELAQRGGRAAAPNPIVGAVVVHNGAIIGEGLHERYGGPHAEVNAITSVQDRSLLAHATLYVTLEPCSHFGKTPPCADLVISSGFRQVVVGCRDPFPQVAGSGIAKLRDAKIEVLEGVLEPECRFANRRFITRHLEGRPYIILKWAQSADGFMAPADRSRLQLSGVESQTLSHTWRTQEMGILVGRVTALADDPQLTARLVPGQTPTRFVIDPALQLPRSLKLFDGSAPTVVLNTLKEGDNGLLRHVRIPAESFSVNEVARSIAQLGITSLIVEGGATTLARFIEAGLWDEARIFECPKSLGQGIPAPSAKGLLSQSQRAGPDMVRLVLNDSLPTRFGMSANLALQSVYALQQSSKAPC